jgi:hypothetical protein
MFSGSRLAVTLFLHVFGKEKKFPSPLYESVGPGPGAGGSATILLYDVLDVSEEWWLSSGFNELMSGEGKFGEIPTLSRNRVSHREHRNGFPSRSGRRGESEYRT